MKIKLSNVGVIKDCDIEFVPGVNLIIGSSGSGKSTLMRCIHNIVTNDFADSDVSFGKTNMDVCIENNGNTIEYIRNLSGRGEKSVYIVNGEQYSKVGRVPLPAACEALKINDIEINGEKINFNFNLQFSSPFLILGSRSTLYNVLTYRSSFDISSINDYYNVDVKSNNSELSSNNKIKEKLEDNLATLKAQADKLSSVEILYCKYTNYKHKLELKNDIEELKSGLLYSNKLKDKIDNINSTSKEFEKICNLYNIISDLERYSKLYKANEVIHNRISTINDIKSSVDNSIELISALSDITKIENRLANKSNLLYRISSLSKMIESSEDILKKSSIASDLSRLTSLLSNYEKCSLTLDTIDTNNSDSLINDISSAMILLEKMKESQKYHEKVKEIESLCILNKERLSEFKVCPLCGGSVSDHL